MDSITYGLDSLWIEKRMDRIASGQDQTQYQRLDRNLAEDIGKPNNNHNLNNFLTKGLNMDNFEQIYTTFSQSSRFIGDRILAEDIGKPH